MDLSMEANNEELRRTWLLREIRSSYINSVVNQNQNQNHHPHSNPPPPYIHNHNEFDNNPLNRLGAVGVGPEDLAFSMERLSLSSSSMSNIPNPNHYDDRLRRNTTITITNSAAAAGGGGIRVGGSQQLYLPRQQDHDFQGLTHFIENATEEVKHRSIELILWEVKDDLHELMMDRSSIRFIETVFKGSTVSQITTILDHLVRDNHKLAKLCIHDDGAKVFQRFLMFLETPTQKSAAIVALKEITLTLAKNINGGYVIQQCLKLFTPQLSQIILEEVGKNCVEIARNIIGCSNYQRCLDQAKGVALKTLIEAVVSNVLFLVEHPYGNFVVKHITKMKIAIVNARILSQLSGKLDELSLHKYGSNVVEGLMEFSDENQAEFIVQELVSSHNFVAIVKSRYGNYVAQRALRNSKGRVNKMLSNSIMKNYPHISANCYGRRVLAFLNKGRNNNNRA